MPEDKKQSFFKSSVIGLLTGFLNGLFGSGGGTVVVPAMEKFLGIEAHKAHATAIAVILPLSVVSAFVYVKGAETDWTIVALISVGGMVGGFIGAKLLNRLTAGWLHKIFGLCMVIAGVRMIF